MTAAAFSFPDIGIVEPRSAALPEMATAVMVLNEMREVEFANDSARALFDGVEVTGCTLPGLLTICDVKGGIDFLETVGDVPVLTQGRLSLCDGRFVDAILKPLSTGGYVLTFDDVTAYMRDAELAQKDALTGLQNRASLHERLQEMLARAKRTGSAVAVICLDLDRFKAVNDTLGHPVGDALLRKVSERLISAVREGDVVARLGGDEFAILQADTAQPQAAQTLATRLVDLIGRTYVVDGHMLNIGTSVGVALSPSDASEPDELMKRADLALYRAKADGRGTFRFFEASMDARMKERRSLELDLRQALAMKEFTLAYQPQYDLGSNTVVGFEALLRWEHPVRGTVSPAEFIPLTEDIGIITPIGEWVLRTACREAAGWARPVSIAVNLSPVQFRSAKLVETILSALTRSGLDPSRLELEITEGSLLANTEEVLATLNRLRALGIRISMDDFGTGYSSISYLQKFPFDKIKIDRAFVSGLGEDADCTAIVRAVASLGASLGIKTTAEGVETPEQLAAIRAEGCSETQGFLTGRPMTGAAAAALLMDTIGSSPIGDEQ
ncbi:EAL domain-containing protein [uncultured Methylobacterium sp.]|uniref:EAL domain-containing protein n=1 Tax=uncultured Methylobacterium sp. TaxID=157278 RepID=UPI0035CCA221